ncbi:NAD(P)H-binding protein [Gammaproteobacteria bacterium]|nr:NAD(P)H-binding protein [Gammaproteobacteria bacterium]
MLDSETTTEQPSVAVVGATGRVGRHVFQGALDRGFKVRALVRNPDKFSVVGDATVIQGDISDPERVRELVDGVDVVLSVLGSRPKESMIVGGGTGVLVEVIRRLETKPRVIHMSSLGIGDSYDQCRKLSWFFAVLMARHLLREVFEDMEVAENILNESPEISSVRVRPTVLTGRSQTRYRCVAAHEEPGKFFIARKQVAEFFLDAVHDKSWDGQAVSLFPS